MARPMRSGKSVPPALRSRSNRATCARTVLVVLAAGLLLGWLAGTPVLAQGQPTSAAIQPIVTARKIFVMLFLMIGPLKILMPFVTLTGGADLAFRRRLATRATLLAAAALALAGT